MEIQVAKTLIKGMKTVIILSDFIIKLSNYNGVGLARDSQIDICNRTGSL